MCSKYNVCIRQIFQTKGFDRHVTKPERWSDEILLCGVNLSSLKRRGRQLQTGFAVFHLVVRREIRLFNFN